MKSIPDGLEELRKARKLLDEVLRDETHVVEIRPDGWTVQHPLQCRRDMFGCPVNQQMASSYMGDQGSLTALRNVGRWRVVWYPLEQHADWKRYSDLQKLDDLVLPKLESLEEKLAFATLLLGGED